MESYLNNNFYGNRSYGVAAAARGYWRQGPQGPHARRSTRCWPASRSRPPGSTWSRTPSRRRTPTARAASRPGWSCRWTAEIVQRRNFILEQMKTRRVLTQGQYTDADYEAAKRNP